MIVSVFGAGSWGTALANLLADNGAYVNMWSYEPQVTESINQHHRNDKYLPNITIPNQVVAYDDFEQVLHDSELILFVIPAQHVRSQLRDMISKIPERIPMVICSKGVEQGSLMTMEQVFQQELPKVYHDDLAVLSGPSFAMEVAQKLPTNVTIAARKLRTAQKVQSWISNTYFRAYTSQDVTGVELGGALKNVIAIAAGASDELKLGYNSRAGLITRGLAEISRLAVRMGARPETLLGLSGVGDLLLTCTGGLSRNRLVGQKLAQGMSIHAIQEEMSMVAEGVASAKSAYELACRHGVDMPITHQVYRVIYEGITVAQAMQSLQERALKPEWGN